MLSVAMHRVGASVKSVAKAKCIIMYRSYKLHPHLKEVRARARELCSAEYCHAIMCMVRVARACATFKLLRGVAKGRALGRSGHSANPFIHGSLMWLRTTRLRIYDWPIASAQLLGDQEIVHH